MTTIPETLAAAIRHHQAGQLPEAESLYRQILNENPQHAGRVALRRAEFIPLHGTD